ncbi:hypothetical protein C1Y63_01085 [Corynebacterium sp. 13CS0277]|uniref:hypothetical protein n=1 Tax=Corynebacterium sp. 13CS0277 TaxID=2071994 RepID=UPI000D0425A4|nr:hypothetical protein [Corynebacterium sp. 13CS0277]PRQ12415.1 hypothetical protein C1Y63_01085 [Corynebacterium sp. 13CS0277]
MYLLRAYDYYRERRVYSTGSLESCRDAICYAHAHRQPDAPLPIDWADQWQAVFPDSFPDSPFEVRQITPELLKGLACAVYGCAPDEVTLTDINTLDDIARACRPDPKVGLPIMRKIVDTHFERAQSLYGRVEDTTTLPDSHCSYTIDATLAAADNPKELFLEQVRAADAVADDLQVQLDVAKDQLRDAAKSAYDNGVSIDDLAKAIGASPDFARRYLRIEDQEADGVHHALNRFFGLHEF